MTPMSWLMLLVMFLALFQASVVLKAQWSWRPAKYRGGITPQNAFGLALIILSGVFLYRSLPHLSEDQSLTRQAALVLFAAIGAVAIFGLVSALNRFTVFRQGFCNGGAAVTWSQVVSYNWNGHRLSVAFTTLIGLVWRVRIRLEPKHFRKWEAQYKAYLADPAAHR